MRQEAMMRAPRIERGDFEIECVREFSHSGVQLGGSVSREERRERIRIAILREDKQDKAWRDTPHTYAAVYQSVYGKPLDSRRPEEEPAAGSWRDWRMKAAAASMPMDLAAESEDDDEDEDSELI